MTAKRSLVKDIGSVFGTKVFVLALGLVSMVILARALGPEGRGMLAAILIYPQLLISLTEGGMRQAAVVFIGKKIVPESEVLGSLVVYSITAGIIGFFTVYSILLWFGPDYFSQSMMLLAAGILPLSLTVSAFRGFFLGKQKIGAFNRILWVQKIIYVSLILALFAIDELTVLTAVAVTFGASLFNIIQAYIHLKKSNLLAIEPNYVTTKRMLRLGVIYAIVLFLIQANYKIDLLIMGWLAPAYEIGNYAVSVQLAELLWQFPSAVVTVLMARTAATDSDDVSYTIAKSCRLTLLITALSSVALLIGVHLFSDILFGDGFELVFLVTATLVPGVVIITISKTLYAYYAGMGKPLVGLAPMAIAVTLNIALNYLLIPLYGALGAAISTMFSYICSSIFMAAVFVKNEKQSFLDLVLLSKADLTSLQNSIITKKTGRYD